MWSCFIVEQHVIHSFSSTHWMPFFRHHHSPPLCFGVTRSCLFLISLLPSSLTHPFVPPGRMMARGSLLSAKQTMQEKKARKCNHCNRWGLSTSDIWPETEPSYQSNPAFPNCNKPRSSNTTQYNWAIILCGLSSCIAHRLITTNARTLCLTPHS